MTSPTGTIVITGGAGGIGHQFVAHFLSSPHAASLHGIYFTHPAQRGRLRELLHQHGPKGHTHEIHDLDLGRLNDVREAAAAISQSAARGQIPPVRAMVHIAGGVFRSLTGDGVDFTEDGYEKTFAVNYLATTLLTLLLLRSCDPHPGTRIIFIGSTSHNPAFISNWTTYAAGERTDLFKDFAVIAQGRQERHGRSDFELSLSRYGTSKFLLITFMYALQRQLVADRKLSNVSVLTMDPGAVAGTSLSLKFPWPLYFIFQYFLVPFQWVWVYVFPNGRLRTASKAGQDLVFACFDKANLGQHPRAVYLNGTEISDSSPETHDEVKQKKLWDETCNILALTEGDIFGQRSSFAEETAHP